MAIDNEIPETDEEFQSPARAVTLFFVVIVVVLSLSLFIFYSTLRSRSMGIATGYLKAIETAYQTGEYHFSKDFPENTFETGIYKVYIKTIISKEENGPIILRVEIKDKFFNVTHHTEELKLIPTINPEP